jgi:glycerol-3-phosphate dehydrogenase (NAD(P)+)
MKNIAIIGSGSWGIALGIHMAKLGHNIKIWSFLEEEANLINNEHKCKFLPEITIPNNIVATQNFEECLKDADYVFHVTPSKAVRETVKNYKKYVNGKPIIMCSKGFERETEKTLIEVLNEEIPNNEIAVFSGPSHAEEVSREIPTAMVLASENNELLEELQSMLMNENLRIYLSNDIKGVELGGSLKNIIAFCAGILVSLNLGDNTFAALITRGLCEISRLGVALGGQKDTFYGLSGLGDLIVTCSSKFSRNRKAGMLIGAGKTIDETKKEVGMTIESIENIEVAYKLGKQYNVDMPIVNTVYDVIYNNLNPREAVTKLMMRDKKFE